MTNPRLPKPLTHSPPTPPTPPPAKQIHISHKTPSPSTTPRISITTRTSNAAERPVPVSSPSATNTQVTLNTTIVTPTATALPTQTQHTDRVVPNSDKTRTIRTAHTANTTSIHKPSSNNERNLIILQVNINGINNKLEELKNTNADIITIQETKLTSKSNTPKVPTYTTVPADRPHKSGGGLITLIRDNITFSPTDIPSTINTHNIELQMVKVHLNNTKHITIANVYIPPRDSTSTHYKTAEKDIQHCIQHITTISHSVLTGNVNAHSSLWHSYTDDHRGQLIAEVISNSDHISLNTDTPTRVPNTAFQQTSSPDITTVSNTLYNRTSWQTHHALSSDHLPIMTTINIRHNFRLQTYRRTFTNYKKANWTQFTKDTELAFPQTTIPDDIHTANRIFTNIILLADKHNIPKGKMPSTSLPFLPHFPFSYHSFRLPFTALLRSPPFSFSLLAPSLPPSLPLSLSPFPSLSLSPFPSLSLSLFLSPYRTLSFSPLQFPPSLLLSFFSLLPPPNPPPSPLSFSSLLLPLSHHCVVFYT